jgi:hypothetical protein
VVLPSFESGVPLGGVRGFDGFGEFGESCFVVDGELPTHGLIEAPQGSEESRDSREQILELDSAEIRVVEARSLPSAMSA